MDSPAAGNAVQTLGAAMRFVGNLYISFFAVFTLAILHNISCFCTLHKFLVSFQYQNLESKYPICYIMNRKGKPQAAYPQIVISSYLVTTVNYSQ